LKSIPWINQTKEPRDTTTQVNNTSATTPDVPNFYGNMVSRSLYNQKLRLSRRPWRAVGTGCRSSRKRSTTHQRRNSRPLGRAMTVLLTTHELEGCLSGRVTCSVEWNRGVSHQCKFTALDDVPVTSPQQSSRSRWSKGRVKSFVTNIPAFLLFQHLSMNSERSRSRLAG